MTKKRGKDDEISDWAKARVAQCLQLKQQLEQALLPGDIVEDEFLRSGRRYFRSEEKFMCKNKPTASQRISTLTPCTS